MKQGSTVYYLFGDHLGSTAITASSAGAKLGELRYKPWGESRYTWGTTYTNRHFTGQLDETTAIGLYFFNARFYDPYLNRWIQPDTIIPDYSDPQDWDRYAYSRNNPVKYIDPDGHSVKTPPQICPGGCPIFDLSNWSKAAKIAATLLLAATVDNLTGGRTGVYEEGKWGVIPDTEYINSGAWSVPPVFGGVVGGSDDFAKASRNIADDIIKSGGETAATIRGREAHQLYSSALGQGYVYNRPLPSGLRPDAVDWENHIVRELKPDNSRAIQRGWNQVRRYLNELFEITGDAWTAFVDTYK